MVDSGTDRSDCPKVHAVRVKLGSRFENVELVSAGGSVVPKHGIKRVSYELADGEQIEVR